MMRTWLLLLAACSGKDDDTGTPDSGCDDISGIEAEVTDVATVIRVSWDTASDASGTVKFGVDALDFETLETSSGTSHESLLVGVPPLTEVQYSVVVDGCETEPQTITTGAVPNSFPAVTVTEGDNDQFVVAPVLGSMVGAVILDPQGNYVWYHEDTRELDLYRVRLLPDASGVMYNAGSVSGDPADDSVLVSVPFDGSSETEVAVPLLAHDFVFLDDTATSIGALAVEYQDKLMGNKIIEIAPDGTQTDVWTSWDCFDPKKNFHDEMDHGWTFGNALDYDPVEDVYYLGMRNFSAIAKIPRATFECEWVFGDVDIAGTVDIKGAKFQHQHQFHVLDDSILLFDNDGPAASQQSRVLEFSFDPTKGTAEEIWKYQPDGAFSFVLGDVQRLDDGDTMVVWSVDGQIDRVDAKGNVEWQVNTELGGAFGFANWATDLYRPQER